MLGGPPVPLLAALSLEVVPCVKFAWHNALWSVHASMQVM